MIELADLAKLEKAKEAKKGKGKAKGNMADAVNSTEAIRKWVTSLITLTVFLEWTYDRRWRSS